MTEREEIFAEAVARQAKRSLEWAAAMEPVASATKHPSEQAPERGRGQPQPQRKQARAAEG
jgi:hypothetical protein